MCNDKHIFDQFDWPYKHDVRLVEYNRERKHAFAVRSTLCNRVCFCGANDYNILKR